MKIVILGFSGGLQAVDTGNSSILVETVSTKILVDVSGSPFSLLLNAGLDPDSLDAVCISHAHVDHLYGFPSLIHNLWLCKRKKPLIVFGNEHTIEKAKALFSLFLLDQKNDMVPIIWKTDLQQVGDMKVDMFPLFHRPLVPTCGFSFKENFGGLCSYFPDNVAKAPFPPCTKDSDIIIHEAQGVSGNEESLKRGGHSSGRMAAQVAVSIGAKKLVLIHLPQSEDERNAILEDARNVFPHTELPYEGETLTI